MIILQSKKKFHSKYNYSRTSDADMEIGERYGVTVIVKDFIGVEDEASRDTVIRYHPNPTELETDFFLL